MYLQADSFHLFCSALVWNLNSLPLSLLKFAGKSNGVSLSSSLPSEMLIKIFSYLDPVSLLSVGCVNKHFYHLANDK